MRSDTVSRFISAILFLIISGNASMASDAHQLARLGGQMTSAEKTSLEKTVSENPSDVESRTKLLGYYFTKGRQDPDAKDARQRHVEWLIKNAPESEVLGLPYSHLNKVLERDGYESARQAWLQVVQQSPENLTVLRNASKFFLLHDRDTAEELLLKGQILAPNDPQWPAALGHLYSLGLTSRPMGPEREANATKAFRQFELAYEHLVPMRRDTLLSDLAKTGLEAGLIDDAKKYAELMLDDDTASWNQGNHIHHGNLILGRIALSSGDVDEAKSRLLLAGKTSGSPQLNSFGPNMLLAKELLSQGENKVVLEYFELCKRFWSSPRRELEQWIDEVKANRMPQFGANLAY
ncbi:tetratricopeptide repeat protein [Novipirellula sp. SH528]|uniref:tetratricopeptide repeat protein n=1 Tax=Novipirellula sp. SH528 TaxID=3454466 RepID=UPI003F9F61F5